MGTDHLDSRRPHISFAAPALPIENRKRRIAKSYTIVSSLMRLPPLQWTPLPVGSRRSVSKFWHDDRTDERGKKFARDSKILRRGAPPHAKTSRTSAGAPPDYVPIRLNFRYVVRARALDVPPRRQQKTKCTSATFWGKTEKFGQICCVAPQTRSLTFFDDYACVTVPPPSDVAFRKRS